MYQMLRGVPLAVQAIYLAPERSRAPGAALVFLRAGRAPEGRRSPWTIRLTSTRSRPE